jgi:hypothetical protein
VTVERSYRMKAIAVFLCLLAPSLAQEKHKIGVAQFQAPQYPTLGMLLRKQGVVVASLVIGANGKVQDVQLEGTSMFYETVRLALSGWRFSCLDCKMGSEFKHRMTFTFALEHSFCDYRLEKIAQGYNYTFPDAVTITSGGIRFRTDYAGLAPDVFLVDDCTQEIRIWSPPYF